MLPNPTDNNDLQAASAASRAQATPSADQLAGELSYSPEFQRNQWTHAGRHVAVFFDQFVPMQYTEGFAWRCAMVGEPERAVPFTDQPDKIKALIANNAEVLLQLLESLGVDKLHVMRSEGSNYLRMTNASELQGVSEDTQLLQEIGRTHHENWLAAFQKALQSGLRSDSDHRGNRPYEELPPIEIEILEWQSRANCRVVANLSEADFDLLVSFARKNQAS